MTSRKIFAGAAFAVGVAATAPASADVAPTLGTAPAAHADDVPAPRTMTLDEALRFAAARHPVLRAAASRIGAAEKDAAAVSAQWLPRVGGMAQVVGSTVNNSSTTILGTPAVDLPRIGATPISNTFDFAPYPSTAIAVGLRQQLFDFGRVAAERAAADVATALERYRASGAMIEVEFAVRQAFYAVVAADGITESSRAAYVRAVSHRDFAAAGVRSGMRAPIELTRAEADVGRYEAAMLRARANVRAARVAFALAVGYEPGELGATAGPPESGALAPLDELVARAERTPSVALGRARIELQRAETRRLEAQSRPTLSATAAVSGRAGGATPTNGPTPLGDGWLPAVPNYGAGVVLTWPFVEPAWDRRADASRARERAAAIEAEGALQAQRALIRTAYHEAAVATETLGAAERNAKAAVANWDQAEHRFGVGLGTSTELADAQALRTEAELQLTAARFQAARARAALERAAGGGPRTGER